MRVHECWTGGREGLYSPHPPLLSSPPKYAVSTIVGYQKGKRAMIVFERHSNLKWNFKRYFFAHVVTMPARRAWMKPGYGDTSRIRRSTNRSRMSMTGTRVTPFRGARNRGQKDKEKVVRQATGKANRVSHGNRDVSLLRGASNNAAVRLFKPSAAPVVIT